MKILWPKAEKTTAPAADEVHLWAVPLDEAGAPSAKHWAVLSPDEQRRAAEFRFDEPRRRFVLARAALRTLLGDYLHVPPNTISLAVGPHGKPRFGGAQSAVDLRFNLAHSGELALVAVAVGCEVGVDIELIREVSHSDHIARRYFHSAEVEAIIAARPSARGALFMRCWTGKEAVLKAVGSGIIGSLAHFRVPTNDHRGAWIELPPVRCWLQHVMPSQHYVGAIASLGDKRRAHCFAFAM